MDVGSCVSNDWIIRPLYIETKDGLRWWRLRYVNICLETVVFNSIVMMLDVSVMNCREQISLDPINGVPIR